MIKCRRCSLEKPPHKHNPHLCEDCVKLENNRVSHFRQHNYNWLDVAKEAELEIWERQPGETDHEYNIWLHYRDMYPGKKPSFKQAALEVGTSVDVVRKVASRWSFPTRMQSWAKYTDGIILERRKQEILDMNKEHVDMAATLRQKLKKAIDLIDPFALSPREINSLMKTATELERKAQMEQQVQTGQLQISDNDNPELKKNNVKTENIQEILTILGGAGLLNNNVGVRQTTTTVTEVVTSDDSGDETVHGVRGRKAVN